MVGDVLVTGAVLVHIRQAKAKFGCCLSPPAMPSVTDRKPLLQYERCQKFTIALTYPQKRHNLWTTLGGEQESRDRASLAGFQETHVLCHMFIFAPPITKMLG